MNVHYNIVATGAPTVCYLSGNRLSKKSQDRNREWNYEEVSRKVKKVLWQELRRTEFEDVVKAGAIVIIPVASIEQHGEHLPVNTDTSACFTIAQRAAQAIDEFPVLVTPVIWTGFSPMHMTYHGTITLKYNTFVELLSEVASCVHAHGFRKIFFLNGHGANRFIINSLRGKLSTEEHVFSSVAYTWWDIPPAPEEMESISKTDKGSIGHAGELETSIQLYLQPSLVDKNAAVWTRGVWGDPSVGTREKGERVIEVAVNALIKILREYYSGELEVGLRDREVFEGGKTIIDYNVRVR